MLYEFCHSERTHINNDQQENKLFTGPSPFAATSLRQGTLLLTGQTVKTFPRQELLV